MDKKINLRWEDSEKNELFIINFFYLYVFIYIYVIRY